MARPIPEVRMLEPGEKIEVNLDSWTPWRRERFLKATGEAVRRWKKAKEAEATASEES